MCADIETSPQLKHMIPAIPSVISTSIGLLVAEQMEVLGIILDL